MMEGLLRLAPGPWILAVYVIKLLVIAGGLAGFIYPLLFQERRWLLAGAVLLGSSLLLGCAYEPAFPYLGRNGALFLGVLLWGLFSADDGRMRLLKALLLTALLMPAQVLAFESYAQFIMRPRYLGYSPVQYLAFHVFDAVLALGMMAVFCYFMRKGLFRAMTQRTLAAFAGGAAGVLLLFDYFIRQYGVIDLPLNGVGVLIMVSTVVIFLLFLVSGLFFQNRRLVQMLATTEQDYSSILKRDLQAQQKQLENFYNEAHDRYNLMKTLHHLILHDDSRLAAEKLEQWMWHKPDLTDQVLASSGDKMVDAVLHVKSADAGDIPLHIQINGHFPPGDHEEIAMVIANLMDNAIAAAGTAENPDISLLLTIKYGMLKGVLVNTCADSEAASPAPPGRGLGIVREILRRHDGRMGIERSPGRYRVEWLAYLNIEDD